MRVRNQSLFLSISQNTFSRMFRRNNELFLGWTSYDLISLSCVCERILISEKENK